MLSVIVVEDNHVKVPLWRADLSRDSTLLREGNRMRL